jgi:hypothetical protein
MDYTLATTNRKLKQIDVKVGFAGPDAANQKLEFDNRLDEQDRTYYNSDRDSYPDPSPVDVVVQISDVDHNVTFETSYVFDSVRRLAILVMEASQNFSSTPALFRDLGTAYKERNYYDTYLHYPMSWYEDLLWRTKPFTE